MSALTSTEQRLLDVLRSQPGRLLSRDELSQAAGLQPHGELSRCVDAAVSRLRRKLAATGDDGALHTEHGDGYRWQPSRDGAVDRFRLGAALVDLARGEVTTATGAAPLTTLETRLLRRLFEARRDVVPAEELLPRASSVAKTVWQLRRKLGAAGALLQSLRHRGYRLDAEPLRDDRFDGLAWQVAATIGLTLGLDDVVVYRRDGAVLQQVAAYGRKRAVDQQVLEPLRLPLGVGIVGDAASSRLAMRVDDTRFDRRYVADGPEARSELTVPILVHGDVVGVIDSEASSVGAFSRSQLDALGAMASLFATSLAA